MEFWGSVLEYACLGPLSAPGCGSDRARRRRARRARAAATSWSLAALADRPLSSLSGGERQRARLALALTQDPVYYLLDEPLQHLDLRHQLQVLALFVAARAQANGAALSW